MLTTQNRHKPGNAVVKPVGHSAMAALNPIRSSLDGDYIVEGNHSQSHLHFAAIPADAYAHLESVYLQFLTRWGPVLNDVSSLSLFGRYAGPTQAEPLDAIIVVTTLPLASEVVPTSFENVPVQLFRGDVKRTVGSTLPAFLAFENPIKAGMSLGYGDTSPGHQEKGFTLGCWTWAASRVFAVTVGHPMVGPLALDPTLRSPPYYTDCPHTSEQRTIGRVPGDNLRAGEVGTGQPSIAPDGSMSTMGWFRDFAFVEKTCSRDVTNELTYGPIIYPHYQISEQRLRENAATTLVRGDDSVDMVQPDVRARHQSHNTLFAKVGAGSLWTDGCFIGLGALHKFREWHEHYPQPAEVLRKREKILRGEDTGHLDICKVLLFKHIVDGSAFTVDHDSGAVVFERRSGKVTGLQSGTGTLANDSLSTIVSIVTPWSKVLEEGRAVIGDSLDLVST